MDTDPTQRTRIRQLTALLAGIGLTQIGTGLLSSLVGVRMSLEGFSALAIGLVGAGYFAGFVLGSLRIPRLVAAVGHIRCFAALAAVACACALVLGLVVSPAAWLALRFLFGVCLAGVFLVVESWIGGTVGDLDRGRVFSVYMVVSLGAVVVGQLLLSTAAPTSATLFTVVGVVLALSLVPMAVSPQQAPVIDVDAPRLSLRALIRRCPLATAGCFVSGLLLGAFYGLGPVFAAEMGMAPQEVAWFMAAAVAAGLAAQLPIGRASDRVDRRLALLGCTAVTVAAALTLALFPGGGDVPWAAVLPFGAAVFAVYPLAVAHAYDRLDAQEAVPASAGLLLAYGVGAVIGPPGGAAATAWLGPSGPWFFCAGCALLLLGYEVVRMLTRARVPEADTVAFVPVPRTSPAMVDLHPHAETPPPEAS